jgi:thiamine pyrophosphokinase
VSRRKRAAFIVANGSLPPTEIIASLLVDAPFILAADGGADKLLEIGVVPNAVLGDFDSASSDLPASIDQILRPDQDHTDLDKAISYLCENGFDTIWMTGVTGDRLDHTYGSLSMLIKYGNRVDLTLVDSVGTAKLVTGSICLETEIGQLISLLALGKVEGIATTGLKWNLEAEALEPGVRDGISNEAAGKHVTVSIQSGKLIVYVHHVC